MVFYMVLVLAKSPNNSHFILTYTTYDSADLNRKVQMHFMNLHPFHTFTIKKVLKFSSTESINIDWEL
jgi:hypothetical protein